MISHKIFIQTSPSISIQVTTSPFLPVVRIRPRESSTKIPQYLQPFRFLQCYTTFNGPWFEMQLFSQASSKRRSRICRPQGRWSTNNIGKDQERMVTSKWVNAKQSKAKPRSCIQFWMNSPISACKISKKYKVTRQWQLGAYFHSHNLAT